MDCRKSINYADRRGVSMRKIKLIELRIKNFQGGSFILRADGSDVDVFGGNGAGKTRLFSAFTFLLFGKDSLGRADFEIKNLGTNGEAEHGLDHEVEAILDVNGQSITLKKVYHEIWSKKRGSAERTLTGNTTDHYIDGVPVKETEYKARITEITGSESIFRLLTSPAVFPSLPWREQRSLLLEVCGNITDAQIIAADETLAPLTDLLKRYTASKTPLDDLKKVVANRRTEINRDLDRIPVRIDEVLLGLPDITGLSRHDCESKITRLEFGLNDARFRLQGIDNGGQLAELSKTLQETDHEISQLQNKYYIEGMRHVTELNSRINEITGGQADNERKVGSLKDEVTAKQGRITLLENEMNTLRAKWDTVDAEEFQNTIETVCYACNRPLGADCVEEARTKALAHFNNDKAERLFGIETKGKTLRAEADKIARDIEGLDARLMEIQAVGSDDQLEMLIAERGLLKTRAEDYSLIPGRDALLAQKATIEGQIAAARAGVSQDKEVIQKEVDDLTVQLREVKEKADRFARRDQGEKRVEELKAEEKRLSREFEDLERQLYLIETFIKTKVRLLTEQINGLFEYVRFKLYDQLVNGGIDECCVATVGGVPYDGGLNSAARTQAGLDIIRTLQRHYGLNCPIWIDNRESCTAIPRMDCQTISLYVSPEDTTLKVKTIGRRAAA
jgi:peptidoglycan hydrolase CwlO-like protein